MTWDDLLRWKTQFIHRYRLSYGLLCKSCLFLAIVNILGSSKRYALITCMIGATGGAPSTSLRMKERLSVEISLFRNPSPTETRQEKAYKSLEIFSARSTAQVNCCLHKLRLQVVDKAVERNQAWMNTRKGLSKENSQGTALWSAHHCLCGSYNR